MGAEKWSWVEENRQNCHRAILVIRARVSQYLSLAGQTNLPLVGDGEDTDDKA